MLLLGIAGGLVLIWLGLIVALWLSKPDDVGLQEALRLLPDVIRLLKRLAGDRTLPSGVRIRLVLLLAYLALPIDLIPDFVPVLGYADDAVIVVIVLRSTARRAGVDALTRHWPGTPEGLRALRRLCGLTENDTRISDE
ncbi:MAG TPA: DUF1232 domain-containing protein [Mycobacterium sp.]|nr:DUF1232 domain-containing protein [Mycobacterium sp.]